MDLEAFTDEVGWNVFEVRRYVELLVPPQDVTIITGRLRRGDLTEAMGEPEDGVWVLGDPEGDRRSRTARPPGPSASRCGCRSTTAG